MSWCFWGVGFFVFLLRMVGGFLKGGKCMEVEGDVDEED